MFSVPGQQQQWMIWMIYRMARKKRPELCVTITAHILYGAKFPLAHLQISMYYYLLINFSYVINECRIMMSDEYPDNDFVFMHDSAPSHRAKATQNFLIDNTPDFISSQEWTLHSPDLNPLDYSVWDISARTCL